MLSFRSPKKSLSIILQTQLCCTRMSFWKYCALRLVLEPLTGPSGAVTVVSITLNARCIRAFCESCRGETHFNRLDRVRLNCDYSFFFFVHRDFFSFIRLIFHLRIFCFILVKISLWSVRFICLPSACRSLRGKSLLEVDFEVGIEILRCQVCVRVSGVCFGRWFAGWPQWRARRLGREESVQNLLFSGKIVWFIFHVAEWMDRIRRLRGV